MDFADFHCPSSAHKMSKQKIGCDKLGYTFNRTLSTKCCYIEIS